jgi:hypothetical protein
MNNVACSIGFVVFCLGCSSPSEAPRDVLVDGSSLPPGFTSLQATGPLDREGQRKREVALAGLAALRAARFKPEYKAERETLVGESRSVAIYPAIPQGAS